MKKMINNAAADKEDIQKELDFLKAELDRFDNLINLTEDGDLLEAYIYEQKAIELKYGYLIKQARDKKINIGYIERCM